MNKPCEAAVPQPMTTAVEFKLAGWIESVLYKSKDDHTHVKLEREGNAYTERSLSIEPSDEESIAERGQVTKRLANKKGRM